MCGQPDFMTDEDELDRFILRAFWAYKGYMQRAYLPDDNTYWINDFCHGVGNRLKVLEKDGELVRVLDD